jgi:hypothetical protein
MSTACQRESIPEEHEGLREELGSRGVPRMARAMAIIFRPTAKTQLAMMTLLALRQMATADGRRRRLLERITTSAATTAIADPPAPIATPTRAEAKAAASTAQKERQTEEGQERSERRQTIDAVSEHDDSAIREEFVAGACLGLVYPAKLLLWQQPSVAVRQWNGDSVADLRERWEQKERADTPLWRPPSGLL